MKVNNKTTINGLSKTVYTRALNKAIETNKPVSVWSKGILYKILPNGKVNSFY